MLIYMLNIYFIFMYIYLVVCLLTYVFIDLF